MRILLDESQFNEQQRAAWRKAARERRRSRFSAALCLLFIASAVFWHASEAIGVPVTQRLAFWMVIISILAAGACFLACHSAVRNGQYWAKSRHASFAWASAVHDTIFGDMHPASVKSPTSELMPAPDGLVLRIGGGTNEPDAVFDAQGNEVPDIHIHFIPPAGRGFAAIRYRHKGIESSWTAPFSIAVGLALLKHGLDLFDHCRYDNPEQELADQLRRQRVLTMFPGSPGDPSTSPALMSLIGRYGRSLMRILEGMAVRILEQDHQRERTVRAFERLREGMERAKNDPNRSKKGGRDTINLYNRVHIELALGYIALVDRKNTIDLTDDDLTAARLDITTAQREILNGILFIEEAEALAA